MKPFNHLAICIGAVVGVITVTGRADDPKKDKLDPPAVQRLKTDLKEIEKQLNDPDPKVRRQAAETLGGLAEALHSIAFGFGQSLAHIDRSEEVILAQLKAIKEMGPSVEFYLRPYLPTYMKHKNSEVRLAAVEAASWLRAKYSHPELIPLVKDRDLRVRQRAAATLDAFGYEARLAAPALIDALRNPKEDEFVRNCAAEALGKMGPWGKPAIPILTEIFKTKENSGSLRASALFSVAQLAPGDKAVVAWLIELLGDKQDFYNRLIAVGALRQMGPEAKEAVPALLRALGADDVKPPDRARVIRLQIIATLPELGPAGREGVPHLVEIVKNKKLHRTLRSGAASALGDLGPAAKDAVQVLRDVAREPLDGDNLEVIEAAQEAIEKIQR